MAVIIVMFILTDVLSAVDTDGFQDALLLRVGAIGFLCKLMEPGGESAANVVLRRM